nr:immunoglobulin heavy chain junction region [Mus musculus]
SVQEKDGWAT